MNALLAAIDVNGSTSAVLSWVGQALLYGTALAAVTWLAVRTVLRRVRPELQAALWLIVLVKFIVPVGPGSSWSLASVGSALREAVVPARSAEASRPAEAAGGTLLAWIEDDHAAAPAAEVVAAAAPKWGLLLGAAYLLGVAASVLLRLGSYRRFVAKCRRLPAADASVVALVRVVCERLGLRRVPDVRMSDEAPAPFVMGVLRPMLVLSRRQFVRPDELEAVVLHEVAHLRRGDLMVRYVQWLAGTLMFFWPVVAWVNRRIDLAREHACDEWALRHGRLSAGEYARCLLRALQPAESRRAIYRPAAMAVNLRTIERRIDMILDAAQGRRTLGAMSVPALVLVAAWAGFVLSGAATAKEPAPAAQETVTVEQDGNQQKIMVRRVHTGDAATDEDVQVFVKHLEGEGLWMTADGDVINVPPAAGAWVDADGNEQPIRRRMVMAHFESAEDLAAFGAAHPTADADGNGEVTRVERLAYLTAVAMSDPAVLLAAHPAADSDANGTLEASEAARWAAGFFERRIEGVMAGPVEAEAIADAGAGDSSGPVRVRLRTADAEEEIVVPASRGAWLVENIGYEPTAAEVSQYIAVAEEAGPKRMKMLHDHMMQMVGEAGDGKKVMILRADGTEGPTHWVGQDGELPEVVKMLHTDGGNVVIRMNAEEGTAAGKRIRVIHGPPNADGEMQIEVEVEEEEVIEQ